MLFTFPSRYLFSIGRKWVFSLGRWSSLLPTGLAWPVVLWMCQAGFPVSHTGLSPSVAPLSSGVLLPSASPRLTVFRLDTPQPPICNGDGLAHIGFGLFPFRSPLLGESMFLSFPRGTEMFQFPRCRFPCLWIQHGIPQVRLRWVPPFGDPRINACLQLPGAFRRSLRPSSPSYA